MNKVYAVGRITISGILLYDLKTYSRKVNAQKRCDELNKYGNLHYVVLCADDWRLAI